MKKTTNQISKDRAKVLNNLTLFKENKLIAVKPTWSSNGITWCDIYNKSNKRRVTLKTHSLFAKKEFLDDKSKYFLKKEWFHNLIK